MNKLILKIVKNGHPKWRVDKIITFYKYNFIFLVLALLLLLSTSLKGQTFLNTPIITVIVIYLINFVVMYFNLHILSRLVTSVVPGLFTIFSGAYISPAGSPPPAGTYALAMALSIVPFILFNHREKVYSISAFVVSTIAILAFNGLNSLISTDREVEYYQSASNDYLFTTFVSSCIIFMGLWLLNQNSRTFENETEHLIKDIEEKKQSLEKSDLELRKTLEAVEQSKKDEAQRQWVTEGLSELSEIIRNNKNKTQQLYDGIISQLVRFGNANQGGLFIVNEEEYELEMVACYAYERKKYVTKKIKFGEGLVGQCYLEKDSIYLTDVPENYINITSGLGHSLPRCIFLIPMMYNETMEGVIELAFFQPLEDYQKDFYTRAATIIASTVSGERISEKNMLLLQQSQLQSNDLKMREEEIRQNLEELQATQEEMLRKEKDYIEKIDRLEKELHALRLKA